MKGSKFLCLLASIATAVPLSHAPISYEEHTVSRFVVATEKDAQIIRSLVANDELGLDMWTDQVKVGRTVDIRIPPGKNERLAELMSINHSQIIDDVQRLIDTERTKSKSVFMSFATQGKLTAAQVFSDYHDLSTIVSFISGLPGTKQISIGKTFLNTDIPGFVFGSGPRHIVYHGGIHAREWISPAVATYITNFLLSDDPDAVYLRSKFTFTVVPVLNVDGYAYTRSNDRLWRKNREPNTGLFLKCVGTDPNRNFGYKWGGEGASSNNCAEDFRGKHAFSSAEATAIANYVKSLSNVISYMDFHAYSQLWMFPYGYTANDKVPDYDTLMTGAQTAVDALQAVHGTSFQPGPIAQTIYVASGSSVDYMYSIGVKYAYTAELRDTGDNGFMLPADQIVPSGEETTKGIVALWKYIASQ